MTDLEDIERNWSYWSKHRKVLNAGGLIDPGYLDEHHRIMCGWVTTLFYDALNEQSHQDYFDQFENLSLFFINNESANAFALETEEQRGVGINLGFLRKLWFLVFRGVAGDDFIPHWFDSNPLMVHRPSDVEILQTPIWKQTDENPWPEDRLDTFYQIYLRALNFLIYHELAHHARGHIPYVRTELGMDSIDEAMNIKPHRGANSDTLRYIEFDADLTALDMILIGLANGNDTLNLDAKEAEKHNFIEAIAIILVFQLLDAKHHDIDVHYKTSHPAPVHRAMRLTSALVKTIGRDVGWSQEDQSEQHDLAWQEAAILAEKNSFPTGRWYGASTEGMASNFLAVEEQKFIEFAKKLNHYNVNN